MPDGEASAATFDTGVRAGTTGRRSAQEFAGKGVNVALGPTINMVRDPRWGRSYETFGEDPYLTGEMATADVQGIQSQGVMAEVKHAAAYNIEQPPRPATRSSTARACCRRSTCPPSRPAIEKGAAAAIMCGYSNGQRPAVLPEPRDR